MNGKLGTILRRLWFIPAAAALIIAAAVFLLTAKPGAETKPGTETKSQDVQVYLDGQPVSTEPQTKTGGGGLRVYITLDGKPLTELPFEEAHTVRIVQPDGGENTVTLTGTSVRMTEANCEGQDCVEMGEVTTENMEMRVMGGFIICLPHRISVEVR